MQANFVFISVCVYVSALVCVYVYACVCVHVFVYMSDLVGILEIMSECVTLKQLYWRKWYIDRYADSYCS